jgi:hypothetical protein
MRAKPKTAADPFSTTEKLMQTFRMPRELVTFLKEESAARGSDLTAHVLRYLDGVRTWCGLPAAAAALLEEDRQALGLGRYEYLLHLLFQRSLDLRERGPGFDGPGARERRRR